MSQRNQQMRGTLDDQNYDDKGERIPHPYPPQRFRFFVELTGEGETEEDAWDNAVEAFSLDPGIPSRTERD